MLNFFHYQFIVMLSYKEHCDNMNTYKMYKYILSKSCKSLFYSQPGKWREYIWQNDTDFHYRYMYEWVWQSAEYKTVSRKKNQSYLFFTIDWALFCYVKKKRFLMKSRWTEKFSNLIFNDFFFRFSVTIKHIRLRNL